MKQFKVMLLVLLAAIFAFTGCDDGGKTSILPIGGGGHKVGDIKRFSSKYGRFNMVYIPGKIFYTGTDDSGQSEVKSDY
jgi:hypothetical protein